MPILFCKFHGYGNDYIVIESSAIVDAEVSDLALAICSRHTGAGADGIAVLRKLDGSDADYFCEIVNPDGSIAGFSGNGTRCAAAYLHYKGQWTERRLRLKTLSGIKVYDLIERHGDGEFWFEAEIGEPRFSSQDIPVWASSELDTVVNEPIEIDGREILFSAVNVGNPVACVFVDDLDFDWRSIGRAMERHRKFPERVNVVFVKVLDRDNIDIRIWERGAGETSSSGTCSTGAAVLSAFLDKTGRNVAVHAAGGTTDVEWREDGKMVITGRADLVFCGNWPS
ncbi:MAG: diaminopimelate epimerase [Pyrinomonadaceae bacterium]